LRRFTLRGFAALNVYPESSDICLCQIHFHCPGAGDFSEKHCPAARQMRRRTIFVLGLDDLASLFLVIRFF
jgi:hypothetical protein